MKLLTHTTNRAKDDKGKFAKTHGLYKHPLYTVWQRMKNRCYNQNCKEYKWYGGRGIEMCNQWVDDFKCFYDWASPLYVKGLEIDRYPNGDGNYEPDNCRFATDKQNSNNRSSTVYVAYNGEEMAFQYACEKAQANPKNMHFRMKRLGLSFEEALKYVKIMPSGENHFRYKNNRKPMLEAKKMILCGHSIRKINRETGVGRATISKMYKSRTI